MIHPTAIVDSSARLDSSVEIGPYCVIGPDVEIGPGTRIGSHVVIEGPAMIGSDNQIYSFAALGAAPQDKKYDGEATGLRIGNGNTIREYCTFNRGTTQDRGWTEIGDDNWIMAYVHLAHDCVVGSHTIFANGTTLAGHVRIEDYTVLGGFTLVHQFVHVGAYAFTAMGTAVHRDIPPYITASGNLAQPHGLNVEGLRRNGFTPEQISSIRRAYKVLYRSGLSLRDAVLRLKTDFVGLSVVERFVAFLENSQRSIIR